MMDLHLKRNGERGHALDEIYKIYTPLYRSKLNITKIAHQICDKKLAILQILQKFACQALFSQLKSSFFDEIFTEVCRNYGKFNIPKIS